MYRLESRLTRMMIFLIPKTHSVVYKLFFQQFTNIGENWDRCAAMTLNNDKLQLCAWDFDP